MLVLNNKIINNKLNAVVEGTAGEGVVLTHNGVFHADEIVAISLLIINDIAIDKVVRTRDDNLIEKFKSSKDGLLIDIGGTYDPANGLFDHHHERDGVDGKASAGIIADMLGITEEKYPALSRLIAEVDQQDIGVQLNEPNHFSNIIKSYNVVTPFGEDNNPAFEEALRFSIRYLLNLKIQDEADYLDKLEVEKAKVVGINDLSVVVRNKSNKFIMAAKFVGKADIIVSYDKQQECWSVQTIPLKAGSFASKYKLLPATKGNVFTHPAGFISKLKSEGGKIYPIIDGVGEVVITVGD